MKKVILFVIDSLHPVVLGRVLSESNAPALTFLAKRGKYIEKVVSSFPTMTPVATSSIVTGYWPDKHWVPGFIWYNSENKRIVDYGATWQSVLKLGPEKVIRNLLKRLNEEHLNPRTPTIYEKLEESGLQTGNINFFIHRASHPYIAKLPFLLSLVTRWRLYREKVAGPKILTLGEMVHPPFTRGLFSYPRGVFNRFGFNDVYSARIAAQLIREGKQPDFLVVYFPDNDKYSHQRGPLRTAPSIERVDKLLAEVLNAFPSWEKALEDNVIIVTGDHAQTTVGLGNEYLIDLDRVLKKFKRLKVNDKPDENKEIAICPNERMAFIYILQRKKEILYDIVRILARDQRNTQIAWKIKKNKYCVIQGGTEKGLVFAKRGPYRDVYGQAWTLEGDTSVVDLKITPEQTIVYGKFPDALARLASALEGRRGSRVVVSAAPGYEYFAEGAPIHPGGGSHGSLEEEDSIVPMIIAGTPSTIENPRIIDLYPFIIKHFRMDLT